jgi:hypothetical protein
MVDFASLLYERTFAVLGVDATLITSNGVILDLLAIDRTSGVEVMDEAIGVATIRPVADVMAADLDGVPLANLDDGTITLNGATWTIKSVMERPAPSGPAYLRLVLIGGS